MDTCKRISVFLISLILLVTSFSTSFAEPPYEFTIGIDIPGNKNAYGPATYHKRRNTNGSQRWHCYLVDMSYDVDIGGGYPYEGNDIAVYVYSRTVSKQVSGKAPMPSIGVGGDVAVGYTFNSYAPLSNSNAEYKIVAVKNNSETLGVTDCGLYCVFNWQPK